MEQSGSRPEVGHLKRKWLHPRGACHRKASLHLPSSRIIKKETIETISEAFSCDDTDHFNEKVGESGRG
jgi:hypothetical protein